MASRCLIARLACLLQQTRGQWDIMFLISAAIGLVTFLLYLMLATDKEQPWNKPNEEVREIPDTPDSYKKFDEGHINEAFEKEQSVYI